MKVNGFHAPILPFMKWAGGKRWLFKRYRDLFPEQVGKLIDPFVGGGSSFFLLQPTSAILGDVNSDLIEIYECVRDRPRELAALLTHYQKKHSETFYYSARSKRPRRKIERAAWHLYLNRTCWNGLFRVNLKGEFNVPIGTKNKVYVSADEFLEASRRLKQAELVTADFSDIIKKAKKGDVVFADPPYFDKHKRGARFVKYNTNIFSWEDQVRLCDDLVAARKRGAVCYVTNSNNRALKKMYCDHGIIRVLTRQSVVAGQSWARKDNREILVILD